MTIKFTRRSLITSALGLAVSNVAWSSGRHPLQLYVEESGVPGDPSGLHPFLVGILTTRDSERLEHDLNIIRSKLSYNLELNYYSTNIYKIDYLKLAVKKVFLDYNSKINIFIISKYINKNRWPIKRYHKNAAYYEHHKKLVAASGHSTGSDLQIILKERSRGSRDADLRSHLLYSFGGGTSVEIVRGRESNILQVCDLVTGSAYGALTSNEQHRSKIKSAANKVICDTFGLPNIDAMREPLRRSNIQVDIIS